MKILSRLRNVLFAFIVLGCFANFAQNDYGLDMILYASTGIALIFLVISILEITEYTKEKKETLPDFLFTFFEKISLVSVFSVFIHQFQQNPSILKVMFLFAAQIAIPSTVWMKKSILDAGANLPAYVNFFGLFIFITLPIDYYLATSGIISFWHSGIYFVFIVFLMTLIHYHVGGKKEYGNFWQYSLSTKYLKSYFATDILSFFITGILFTYMFLSVMKIAPEIQSASLPPAYRKLLKENKKAQAGKYIENYYNFLENRKKENNTDAPHLPSPH